MCAVCHEEARERDAQFRRDHPDMAEVLDRLAAALRPKSGKPSDQGELTRRLS